jgi:ribosomal protein S27E
VQKIFSNVLGCYKITTVFSHAQTVVLCVSCSTVLCQPTGGRARLTEGVFVVVDFKMVLFLFSEFVKLRTPLIILF